MTTERAESYAKTTDNGCGSIVVSVILNRTTLYHIQGNETLCE